MDLLTTLISIVLSLVDTPTWIEARPNMTCAMMTVESAKDGGLVLQVGDCKRDAGRAVTVGNDEDFQYTWREIQLSVAIPPDVVAASRTASLQKSGRADARRK